MKIKLREIRKKTGISYRKLEKASGVSFSQIQKIENGAVTNPKLETVCKLAKALGVGLDDLIEI